MQSRVWKFSEYGDPSVLQCHDETLPEPGPGQVTLRLKAIGLNRAEFNFVAGNYVPARSFPTCLGHEAIGEIIAAGPPAPEQPPFPGVSLEPGTRVALRPGAVDVGGMGSYRTAGLYSQAGLLPVPERFTDQEAAGFWMGVLTAGGGLRVAGITPDNAAGKRVLVTAGASGMGVMALKIARAWGAETLATTRGEAKRAALSDLADHVLVCPEASALPDLVKQAGEGEKGIDAAFDPIGGDHVPAMIQAANPLAKLVVYERLGGAESTLHLASLMIKDVSLVGFTLFRLMREPALLQEVVRDALARAGDLRPIVAGSFPFDEAPEALRTLGQSAHLGKLVIDVG